MRIRGSKLRGTGKVATPVVYALQEFDAKEPSMGKVLAILRDLETHILDLRTENTIYT